MKSNFKWHLVIAVLVFSQAFIKADAQTGIKTQLNIFVAGIEYEDARFAKLKEGIKKNKNVQEVKQSFSQNTARLSLTYTGDATQLWDEIPADLKQPFKITSMESDRIELQPKNMTAVKSTPPANNSPVSNATTSDDCKNCYWNMCKYDVTKSIGGKLYRGTITEYGTVYYNCVDGIVLQTSLNINAYGSTVIAGTDTVLISSGPVGTRWGVINTDEKNSF